MKNILFISPSFFGYYKNIIKQIEKNGDSITWFDDRPSNSFIIKSLIRINSKLAWFTVNKYLKKIKLEMKRKKYDIFLVIFGQCLNARIIDELRQISPSTKFIYFTWDSLSNYKIIGQICNKFDVRYSFDPYDCKKYGFEFLPLFYIDDIKENNNEEKKYDAVAIFTVKPGKLKNYNYVISALPPNIKMFTHLYIQSKLLYFYYKIRYHKEFKNYKMSDFRFYKLSKKTVDEYIKNSRVVIDCQMHDQIGLTMRTFETLAMCKKLITSNDDIKNYDFYAPSNICIVDENTNSISEHFFNDSFDIRYKISNKYSITSFVNKLLS